MSRLYGPQYGPQSLLAAKKEIGGAGRLSSTELVKHRLRNQRHAVGSAPEAPGVELGILADHEFIRNRRLAADDDAPQPSR